MKHTDPRSGPVSLAARCVRSIAVLLLFAGTPAGCYRHVVSAEGFGADRITTYEPNIEPEPQEPADRRRQIRDLQRSAPKPPQPY